MFSDPAAADTSTSRLSVNMDFPTGFPREALFETIESSPFSEWRVIRPEQRMWKGNHFSP